MYAPTLKEDPVDAPIASHKLLLRAGMMRKCATRGSTRILPWASA
jgi:prolyl-tRNA synthetase